MDNGDTPSYPIDCAGIAECSDKTGTSVEHIIKMAGGLTKRERFAGLALQALIANGGEWGHTVSRSIMLADALLEGLENDS